MISAQLKDQPTSQAPNSVRVDKLQVVPTPLFKIDARHRDAKSNQYVNQELIEYYRPLVGKIVNRMMVRLPSHVDAEDLYSVGLMALITASKRYTAQNRETFKAYVKTRIRGAIYDELRRLDCLPRSARAKVRKIQDTSSQLEQKLGRAPTETEVRHTLQLSEKEYTKMVRRTRPINLVSLDATIPGKDNEQQNLHEVIADENTVDCSEEFSRREMVAILAEKIEAMPERHRQILAMYYFEGLRISEIAKVFEITEARVCQIQSYALSRLRKYANAVFDK